MIDKKYYRLTLAFLRLLLILFLKVKVDQNISLLFRDLKTITVSITQTIELIEEKLCLLNESFNSIEQLQNNFIFICLDATVWKTRRFNFIYKSSTINFFFPIN